ncbi:MAG: sensor histidine kinase [Arenimonas sp.]
MTKLSSNAGLRRKIWTAFILQAAVISFAAVLGVYGASIILKHVLIRQALEKEAAHYWDILQANKNASAPDTYNMKGYLLFEGDSEAVLPESMRGLSLGFHSLPQAQGGSLILVEQKGDRHLFLQFKQEQVDALAFWFGMVPLALVLAVVYLIAFSTYRASKRAVSPVIWLANQVKLWDPKNPDANSIKPENLPSDVEGETFTLASSLHDYASRINNFVERERNFTRDASHELRTPLTVIRVAGDIMCGDEGMSASSKKSLTRIKQAGRDMEALIESFLILAREGDTGLPDEEFSVAEVVADEVDKAQVLLLDKPVELKVEVVQDFDLFAPSRVLSVMLGNLLRNACNYTDQGLIRVSIELGRISVIDTGIGMAKEDLDKVYDTFFRGNNHGKDGQGVGLSIVRRLSDRYHWPVKLDSSLGQGTCASIEFPKAILR